MKKRFLVTLLVVCVLLPAALSAAAIDLSLGATAQYNGTLADIKADMDGGSSSLTDKIFDFENYTLGADVRIKLLFAEVDVVGTFAKYIDDSDSNDIKEFTEISALTTVGFSFDLAGFARIGLGVGPRFRVLIDKDGNPSVFASDGNGVGTWEGAGDAFLKSPIAARATVDFNLGHLMLGLNYTLDTGFTFENKDFAKLIESPDGGRFGVSLLFSLF